MVAKAGYFHGLRRISLYLVTDVALLLLAKLHLNLETLQIFGGSFANIPIIYSSLPEQITDAPMAALSKCCEGLQELSIITTSKTVTDAGIMPFARTCTNLSKLTLRCENVSHAAVTLMLASAHIKRLDL